jgi:hypothetical protein
MLLKREFLRGWKLERDSHTSAAVRSSFRMNAGVLHRFRIIPQVCSLTTQLSRCLVRLSQLYCKRCCQPLTLLLTSRENSFLMRVEGLVESIIHAWMMGSCPRFHTSPLNTRVQLIYVRAQSMQITVILRFSKEQTLLSTGNNSGSFATAKSGKCHRAFPGSFRICGAMQPGAFGSAPSGRLSAGCGGRPSVPSRAQGHRAAAHSRVLRGHRRELRQLVAIRSDGALRLSASRRTNSRCAAGTKKRGTVIRADHNRPPRMVTGRADAAFRAIERWNPILMFTATDAG